MDKRSLPMPLFRNFVNRLRKFIIKNVWVDYAHPQDFSVSAKPPTLYLRCTVIFSFLSGLPCDE